VLHLYYGCQSPFVSVILLAAMSPVVTIVDDGIGSALREIQELERAFHGPASAGKSTDKINNAQLTVTRNAKSDFQDRQVYLYLDGELLGKVKYGKPMSREIPPGPHKVRAFNTLFSHTIDINPGPGEHIKLRCTNGLGRGGWIMMVIWQMAPLTVTLERE
jgi:hypothetical protein